MTFWTKIEVLSKCARVHGLFLCDVIISVCETVYHQKNVTEVQPTCKTIMMPMCMKNENGVENCVQIPRKVIWIFAPKSLNFLMFELSRLQCMKCFDALIDLNFRAKNALKCIYEITEMSFCSLNFRAKNIHSYLMGCNLSNVKSKKWFDSEQCHKQVVNKSSVKYVGTKCVPWLSKKLVRINPKQ